MRGIGVKAVVVAGLITLFSSCASKVSKESAQLIKQARRVMPKEISLTGEQLQLLTKDVFGRKAWELIPDTTNTQKTLKIINQNTEEGDEAKIILSVVSPVKKIDSMQINDETLYNTSQSSTILSTDLLQHNVFSHTASNTELHYVDHTGLGNEGWPPYSTYTTKGVYVEKHKVNMVSDKWKTLSHADYEKTIYDEDFSDANIHFNYFTPKIIDKLIEFLSNRKSITKYYDFRRIILDKESRSVTEIQEFEDIVKREAGLDSLP